MHEPFGLEIYRNIDHLIHTHISVLTDHHHPQSGEYHRDD